MRCLPIFRGVIIAQNDNHNLGIKVFCFLSDDEAVSPGQFDVHEDQIRPEIFDFPKRLFSLRRLFNAYGRET